MAVTASSSLRPRHDYDSWLVWAFILSLLIHALIFGTWKLDRRHHFTERIQLPAWLQPHQRRAERVALPPLSAEAQQPPVLEVLPSHYVDVNPAVATAEPPKETKFYSTANSVAANPNADLDTAVPKIEGTQTRIVKTETVKLLQPVPLLPATPIAKPVPAQPEFTADQPKPETIKGATTPEVAVQPKATTAPGDLTLAKPNEVARKGEGQAERSKPQTVKEAIARLAAINPAAAAGLVGEKMKQEGGVKHRNVTSSLDVRSSPFGAYDQAIIYAVQARWYALLDSKNYAGEANGKIALEFRLHQDGRVTDLKVNQQSVDEIYSIICQRAILDNAPYEKWPPDMRRMIQKDYRDVTFTFYYN